MTNAGPPPVQSTALSRVEQNYITIVDALKQNNGAEARAIRAMFGGDKQLMDTFLAVAFSSLANNNDLLQRATPMSIIQSIKDAASLGLKPDGIEGAIVRYGDVAKFMPMYQGYKRRMMRSKQLRAVDAKTVYTGDEFDYWVDPANGFQFVHHPAKAQRDDDGNRLTSRGAYMGFYAYAPALNGFVYGRYMDVDEVIRIRDAHGATQTRDGKPLPWATDFEAMALKTVIRQLQKDVPQESTDVELQRVEAGNDEEIAKLRESTRQLSEGMADVRSLALRAVGQLPAGNTDATTEAAGDSEELRESEGKPDATAPNPGQDPNVAAAMSEADEQLRRQRARR